jgi:DNA polymerase I-like protein with 3'-5' exonuclease and polymerase domains
MQVIDQTIRMFTEPKFRLNKAKLEEYLAEVVAQKEALIAAANEGNRDKFMSDDKFAELLKAEGVDPPMKWSDKKNKQVYAFAKTSKGMKDLLDHDNPRVQALVACRLGVKTTIEETRTARLIDISTRGLMPIMLNYWGAGTGRFSGGDKINPQNFKRGSKVREAIEAIAGHAIIDSDLSQIEARILALIAGQDDLIVVFAENGDPYCVFASDVFGRTITKADKNERFLGKTCILGLGYYVGAAKLRETLRQGGLTITLEEAERIVKLYRKKYAKIATFWRTCGRALENMVSGGSGYISEEFNIRYEKHTVILPNGAVLRYPGLENFTNPETGEKGMRYLNRGKWDKIYSGLLCENIVQALARGVICEYLTTIGQKYFVALQVHDSIVAVVAESVAAEAKAFIEKVMSIPVDWLPGLPVACECKEPSSSYG